MFSMMRRVHKTTSINANAGGLVRKILCSALPLALGLLLCAGSVGAQMDDIDRARRMHDRLTGVPPDDVTLESVAAAPDDYRGQVVEWDLQFISLERAEEIRTDFYETEPFLLTRVGDGDEAFVYVAVPPERLAEAERLDPLERIRVLGRVRTGSARLTGSPILELLSFERIP